MMVAPRRLASTVRRTKPETHSPPGPRRKGLAGLRDVGAVEELPVQASDQWLAVCKEIDARIERAGRRK
jgi:hypothetical protein